MPESDSDRLLSQISKGSLHPLYLLQGPEEWLKERIVEHLKTKLFTDANKDFNFSTFDGAQHGAGEILTCVQTAPFLADKRLIVVKNCQEMSSAESKILSQGLEDLPSFSCLVLLYNGKADRRDPVPARVPQSQVFTFWPPFPSQLPNWIAREVGRLGKKIDPDAARVLADLFPSLQELSSELEKLILYIQDSPRIELSHVQELSNSIGTASLWELDSSIQARNMPETLTKTNSLLKGGRPPEVILSSLERMLRMMLLAKALEEEGVSAKDITSQFGIRGITREEAFIRGLRRYRKEELTNALLKTERCEWEIKSGVLNGEVALTLLLVKLIRTK